MDRKEEKTMTINIDVEALREAVKNECYAAAFGGGFGGALMESFDADRADAQELADMAQRWGIDVRRFETD